MLNINLKVKTLAALGLILTLAGCKQVALLSASDSSQALAAKR